MRVRVASLKDLPDKQPVPTTAGTKALVVVRDGDRVYVADGICAHGRWLLSLGTYDGGKLTCKGHGTVYDMETGEGDLKGYKYRIRVYKPIIQDGEIYIEI